eukprot:scaffold35049_cov45-Phaeocystis_antarctica.AAC.1
MLPPARGRTSGRWSGAPCARGRDDYPPCLPTGQSRATPAAAASGSRCIAAHAAHRAGGARLVRGRD